RDEPPDAALAAFLDQSDGIALEGASVGQGLAGAVGSPRFAGGDSFVVRGDLLERHEHLGPGKTHRAVAIAVPRAMRAGMTAARSGTPSPVSSRLEHDGRQGDVPFVIAITGL